MANKNELFEEYGTQADWCEYQIVTIHPLADEPEKLQAANLSPDDCVEVGLHWLYKGHIFFVDICSYNFLYTFAFSGAVLDVTNADEKHSGSINVRTDEFPLYRATVTKILNKLAAWIEHNPEKLQAIYLMPPDPDSGRKGTQIIENIDL